MTKKYSKYWIASRLRVKLTQSDCHFGPYKDSSSPKIDLKRKKRNFTKISGFLAPIRYERYDRWCESRKICNGSDSRAMSKYHTGRRPREQRLGVRVARNWFRIPISVGQIGRQKSHNDFPFSTVLRPLFLSIQSNQLRPSVQLDRRRGSIERWKRPIPETVKQKEKKWRNYHRNKYGLRFGKEKIKRIESMYQSLILLCARVYKTNGYISRSNVICKMNYENITNIEITW